MKKIVFTGGGTAGHITPNIAIIDKLKDYEIYYLGTNGMEKDIITKYKNIKFIEAVLLWIINCYFRHYNFLHFFVELTVHLKMRYIPQ